MNNDISVAVLPYVVEHIANRDGAEALGKNVYAAADVSDVIDVIDGYASLLRTVFISPRPDCVFPAIIASPLPGY